MTFLTEKFITITLKMEKYMIGIMSIILIINPILQYWLCKEIQSKESTLAYLTGKFSSFEG